MAFMQQKKGHRAASVTQPTALKSSMRKQLSALCAAVAKSRHGIVHGQRLIQALACK